MLKFQTTITNSVLMIGMSLLKSYAILTLSLLRSHILQYQALSSVKSRRTKQSLRQNYTLIPVREQAVIQNMLLFGMKHGVLMLNGMDIQAIGKTFHSTEQLF